MCDIVGLDICLDRDRRILAVGEPLLMTSLVKSGVTGLAPAGIDDIWSSLSNVQCDS
jgi:hypothetical protein